MGKTFNPYTIIILFSDVVKGRKGVNCNASAYFHSLIALPIAQKEKMVPLGLIISLPSTLTYSCFVLGTSHPQVSWKSGQVWHSARIQKTLLCGHSDSLKFKNWLSVVKRTTQRKPWQCTENSRSDGALSSVSTTEVLLLLKEAPSIESHGVESHQKLSNSRLTFPNSSQELVFSSFPPLTPLTHVTVWTRAWKQPLLCREFRNLSGLRQSTCSSAMTADLTVSVCLFTFNLNYTMWFVSNRVSSV